MILNNRKDTYDVKLSKRRIQFTGRCAARSDQTATGEKRKAAAHGSEAGRKDQRSGNPGQRPSRIYPGVQARAGEAGGRQRAQQRHHPRAERGHRRPQVPAGDANQLRRRITNRGLRAPSPHTSQRASIQARKDSSSRCSSSGRGTRSSVQALKPRSASSWTMDPGQSITDR